ncbi:hypothetical protein GII33_13995 [Gordonia pseudamarae]|jgi:hypothetical protein|uniref:Uncharacterized protein n=1 Tax=Gordonia pseudamarae TaxID=2831662 RepID=A0ABX6IKA0_9ACTN|nr:MULTISPECIES: hypothetical protein [Gordonia]MBD0024449.1 hypothetical protein [Gordonia sp. (in: high G+C Gram-positive bacteria)]QHN26899.1 hypothetical protein GII33_13995 [Gordonia pseudamarae]QHN35789.1 hypothetical protein GII31_13820 [Gordonia pseudamarae]
MTDDTAASRPSALDIVRAFADDGGDLIALHRLARARAGGAVELSGPGSAVSLVWGQGRDEAALTQLARAARIEAVERAALAAERASDEELD